MADAASEIATMKAKIEEKTGKSFDSWVELARSTGFQKHGELTGFLEKEHGFTRGYANLVAHTVLGSAASMTEDRDALVEAQYAGKKEHLRPIYDRLVEIIQQSGDDIEFLPMKAYVSVRRSKQFAIIQPATTSRVDLGLKLKGVSAGGRLEAGGFNGMVTHRIKLSDLSEIDSELEGWLQQAYNEA